MDSLEVTDAESAAVQKTPNRVSLESIRSKVAKIEFASPDLCPHMTVAFVQMDNGFVVIGESAPADPENYDAELGKNLAVDNAIRKVWPLEGYALRERMSGEDA